MKQVNLVDHIDEHGFEVAPWIYWQAESKEDEILRLNYNLTKYEIGSHYLNRYPPEVHKARLADYQRIKALGGEVWPSYKCLYKARAVA